MKFEVTLTMRPPGLVQRLWYWSIRLPVPLAVSRRRRSDDWIRLLPQSWTRIHQRHAAKHGLYWTSCLLCSRPYGGHQHAGSIPDPTGPPGSGVGICPACTRAGRSWDAPHPLEQVLDQINDEHDHGHEPMIRDCLRCVDHDAAIRKAFDDYKEGR